MKATIKDGVLIIEVPMNAKPTPSATGKTLVVASSHGNKPTTAKIGDQQIVVGVNAYVPNAAYKPAG